MKILLTIATLSAALLSASANAQAPTWNDAQMTAWAFVEQPWADDAAENGKWPNDYIHEKYSVWSDRQAAPWSGEAAIAWNRFNDENSETLMYRVSPHAISVAGESIGRINPLFTEKQPCPPRNHPAFRGQTSSISSDAVTWLAKPSGFRPSSSLKPIRQPSATLA